MKAKLVTDFHDYYDWAFDREGTEFKRIAKGGYTRQEALQTLNAMNLLTPRCGYPRDWKDNLAMLGQMWVVHTDPYAHCGDGKVLLSGHAALAHYPNTFATAYIPSDGSLRWLQVGNRSFWLSYKSKDDWRSNCGDVTIEFLQENPKVLRGRWPLLAIDFVRDLDIGAIWAIDLNTAPGLRGTGMEDVLQAREVVDLIKSCMD